VRGNQHHSGASGSPRCDAAHRARSRDVRSSITSGHLDTVGRAVELVDKLIIGVAINEGKGPLFTLEERTRMVLDEARRLSNGTEIEARPFDNLLMHFAEECGCR